MYFSVASLYPPFKFWSFLDQIYRESLSVKHVYKKNKNLVTFFKNYPYQLVCGARGDIRLSGVHVEVTGQAAWVGFILLPPGILGSNSGCQKWGKHLYLLSHLGPQDSISDPLLLRLSSPTTPLSLLPTSSHPDKTSSDGQRQEG